jgi:hypothetical protein
MVSAFVSDLSTLNTEVSVSSKVPRLSVHDLVIGAASTSPGNDTSGGVIEIKSPTARPDISPGPSLATSSDAPSKFSAVAAWRLVPVNEIVPPIVATPKSIVIADAELAPSARTAAAPSTNGDQPGVRMRKAQQPVK